MVCPTGGGGVGWALVASQENRQKYRHKFRARGVQAYYDYLAAVLMRDLLANAGARGSIRQNVVNISDTTYMPTQVPALLEEMFNLIVEKARQIKNPVESAFFLWVNLAYLQPFRFGTGGQPLIAGEKDTRNDAPVSWNIGALYKLTPWMSPYVGVSKAT